MTKNKVVIPFSNGVESMCLLGYYKSKGWEVYPVVFESDSTEYANRKAAIIASLIEMDLYKQTKFLALPDTDFLQSVSGYIPGYKLLLIMAAMSYAASIKANTVALGHNIHNLTQIYPDQKPEFWIKTMALFNETYGTDILIENPFIQMTKDEVIYQATVVGWGVLLAGTVSCDSLVLTGTDHCGTCQGCGERKKAWGELNAFSEGDPEVEINKQWLDPTYYRK